MTTADWLQKINLEIAEKNGQIKEKQDLITKKTAENKQCEENYDTNLKKKFLLQEACNLARKTAYDSFANISTSGLQQVFGDNIFVEIIPGEKDSVPTADFAVRTVYEDYETCTDPTDSDGGGVADIISLSAFICMNVLSSESNTAPLFLDEPTKFVSAGHATSVAEFLKSIADYYNKQIIMVTHAKETQYSADTVFHVELDEFGKSVVKEVETE